MGSQRIFTDITNIPLAPQVGSRSCAARCHASNTLDYISQTLEVPCDPRGALDTRKLARAKGQQQRREKRREEEITRKAKRAQYDREYRARKKMELLGPTGAPTIEVHEDEEVLPMGGESIRLNQNDHEVIGDECRTFEEITNVMPVLEIHHISRDENLHQVARQEVELNTREESTTLRGITNVLPNVDLQYIARMEQAREQRKRRATILREQRAKRPRQERIETIHEERQVVPVIALPPPPLARPSRAATRIPTLNIARRSSFNEADVFHLKLGNLVDPQTGRHDIGRMDVVCPSCFALHWKGEVVKTKSVFKDSPFGMCCDHGRVELPHLRPLPPVLASLLSGQGERSKHFLQNARAYNCSLQLASTGADNSREEQGYIKHFRIQGKIYHSIGPLRPEVGQHPVFAQLYIYDTEHEINNRERVMSDRLNMEILIDLQSEIHEHNAYVRSFRAIASHVDCEDRNIVLRAGKNRQDARRYNLPTTSEVAAIIPGDGTEQTDRRDIIVYVNGGGVRHISDANEAYIPLHFVLLFPYGEAGWHPGIPKNMLSHPDNGIEDSVQQPRENISHEEEGREVEEAEDNDIEEEGMEVEEVEDNDIEEEGREVEEAEDNNIEEEGREVEEAMENTIHREVQNVEDIVDNNVHGEGRGIVETMGNTIHEESVEDIVHEESTHIGEVIMENITHDNQGENGEQVVDNRDIVQEVVDNIVLNKDVGGDRRMPSRVRGMSRRIISAREFAAHRLHARKDSSRIGGSRLLSFGRLTEEWIVDVYGTIQGQRLSFHYKNQDKYRAHSYRAVRDAFTANDANISNIGRHVILPSSFTGGPRHMHQLYQDAMSIVRVFGKPDYFLTMTCNPNWPEIQRELLPGQTWNNRPDLVARVFRQKKKALLELIMKKKILGRVVARIYTIEFQKRGLPHMHALLIMGEEDKPRSLGDIDAVISAEIPDPDLHPRLYETVTNCMMHGPCGHLNPKAPCTKDKKCTKGFPKNFASTTTENEDGYPTYQRRENGRKVKKGNVFLDNRWVIPYNPLLCTLFDCHINLEIVSSIQAVKYIYKYVYKGGDKVSYARTSRADDPQVVDEIASFQDARYISSAEACWRILEFPLHDESPNVVRLTVHLPDEQVVFYREHETTDSVLNRGATTLTEWFKTNESEPTARRYFYHQFPQHYVWGPGKKWHPRKNSKNSCGFPIGRVYITHPGEGERHWLRLLLHHISGAKRFEDLRTVDGIVHETFKEAAIAKGLLEDDREVISCLQESSSIRSGRALRELFALILAVNVPASPIEVWEQFLAPMTEDLLHSRRQEFNMPDLQLDSPLGQQIINAALLDIDTHLQDHNMRLSDFPQMPQPEFGVLGARLQSHLEAEELSYDVNVLRHEVAQGERSLNEGQRRVWDAVNDAFDALDAHRTPEAHIFFVDGLGGTGKTFLYNLLLGRVRCEGHIALAVASSGIAALLLDGGRTAHSRFKIPVKNLNGDSTSFLNKESDEARLIFRSTLVIWDEAPMMSRYTFEVVNRLLQDVMGRRDLPFGGKLVVFGGDFRQVLPIVPRGDRPDIVRVIIKRSSFWSQVRVLKLTENMRVRSLSGHAREEQQAFSDWLLQIGEGRVPTEPDLGEDVIRLPDDMVMKGDAVIDLINEIYGHNHFDFASADFLRERVIVTTTNKVVDEINAVVMDRFPGEERVYLSADSIADAIHGERACAIYPTEFLNTLLPSGMPPHKLILKVGAPIMLLRNMNGVRGQANGTRLIVRGVGNFVIDAEIISGKNIGARVFIPRIPLISSDPSLPFQLRRYQYPIRPAFGMTINKSQGQTLQKIGVFLPKPVFGHGQLYVAASRVGAKNGLRFMLGSGNYPNKDGPYTRNVVYHEVL